MNDKAKTPPPPRLINPPLNFNIMGFDTLCVSVEIVLIRNFIFEKGLLNFAKLLFDSEKHLECRIPGTAWINRIFAQLSQKSLHYFFL